MAGMSPHSSQAAAALSPLLPTQRQADGPPAPHFITPSAQSGYAGPGTSTAPDGNGIGTGMGTGTMGGGAGAGVGAGMGAKGAVGGGGLVGGALERRLGLVDLILLGIGASIGSGIFVVTGIAAKQAGPSVVLSFALAGLASVADALCYAELSSRFPGLVGGAYLYSYSAFGELPAFLLFCHLMFDYHIGAASIARSLASYLATLVQDALGPGMLLPAVLAPGGMSLLGGVLSVNLLAPFLLLAITGLLCRGVRESASVNGVLTAVKVAIVVLVVVVGSTLVQPRNWVPFAPNGVQAVVSTASVVFFSYIGFDAVANTAEESRNPQRDVPLGILVSLSVCAALYIAVCLVLTGMVPYASLDPSAPLAAAFAARGMRGLEAFIDAGAVVGLTTTLLAGLYVQARLYLALARDGLLPQALARVQSSGATRAGQHPPGAPGSGPGAQGPPQHPQHPIPLNAQLWVGLVAATLAALFDVSRLSHVLSVGVLLSYSLVCVCVPILRMDAYTAAASLPGAPPGLTSTLGPTASSGSSGSNAEGASEVGITAGITGYQSLGGESPCGVPQAYEEAPAGAGGLGGRTRGGRGAGTGRGWGMRALSPREKAVVLFSLLALLSVLTGLTARFSSSPLFALLPLLFLLAASTRVSTFQLFSKAPPGFRCPGVPWLPLGGMLVNMFLISQMHPEAWLRLVLVTLCALGFYFTLERNHPRPQSALCSAACSAAACGAPAKGLQPPPGATENEPLVSGA